MKDKADENQESEEQKIRENWNLEDPVDSPFSMTVTPSSLLTISPEIFLKEPLPEENEEKEKTVSYRDDPEALKAIEQFKAYSTKIRPPME